MKQKLVLFCDLLRLAWLVRSFRIAYCYLRQNHPLDLILCYFGNLKFYARRSDWPVLREIFFYHEYDCVQHLFKKEDIVRILDLGAHIGSFALISAYFYKNAQICSVEAASDTADVLEKNIQANQGLSWHLVRGAVWKNNEALYLRRSGSSLGHHVENTDTGERVISYTLDDLIKKMDWNTIDLIKMDIEGAELELVPHSKQVLACARFVLMEVHGDDAGVDFIRSELKSKFPVIYAMHNRGSGKPVFLFSREMISSPPGWSLL